MLKKSDSLTQLHAGMTDRVLESPIPEGFAKYDDVQPFAEGGGAVLRTGMDPGLCRRVVLKTMLSKYADEESMRARFIREARVTALIQHPGTVPVYEIGVDDQGNTYFAMKKIEGYSLKEILEGLVGGRRDFDEFRKRDRLLDVVIRAGEAVASAHASGVIHRDIKPENIRVGRFGEVVVMDWGVAKLRKNPGEVADEFGVFEGADDDYEKGKLYGTPRFMAPEQTWGSEGVGVRSDVFSLAAVLYECITLRPLVFGTDPHELVNKIRNEIFVPARLREPTKLIPIELDAICMKALRKQPKDRYASMDDFLEDLRRFQRGEPVEALEETIFQRVIRWRRNHPRITSAVEFLILGFFVGLVLGG